MLPLLIHGDAAFAGQGVVAETLNLSALRGYRTGGTVHLVINNQVGFTTAPESARSSVYATDVAKMVQAPIFHVNGDDPEACVRVARLAFAFRQAFHKDVVIDMVCYRRFGHNEADEPSYTQPQMYERIENRRTVRKLYTEALVNRGDITIEEAERRSTTSPSRLQAALDETRQHGGAKPTDLRPAPSHPRRAAAGRHRRRPSEVLDRIAGALHHAPDGFTRPPQAGQAARGSRRSVCDGRQGRLGARRGARLRLAAARGHTTSASPARTRGAGTFSQRHAVLVDYETGAEYVPLDARSTPTRAAFFIYDSLLSEYAALGFEYGYSVVHKDALVAWEAQFGDFVNGAQIIIDQFLVAAEDKWGQTSGLVLLLPHGYEGQGPEHSSARIERFLDLRAEDNIQVVQRHDRGAVLPRAAPPVACATSASRWSSSRRSRCCGAQERAPSFARRRRLRLGSFHEVHRRRRSDRPRHGRARRPGQRARSPSTPSPRRDNTAQAAAAVVRVEQLYPWPEDELRCGPRPVPERHRGRLAAGGAGEHGRVVVRARSAAGPRRRSRGAFRGAGRVG